MAGIYLVSIDRSRYSAVHGGAHAKTAFLHARPSAWQRISDSTLHSPSRGNPKKFQLQLTAKYQAVSTRYTTFYYSKFGI
jgi:hypothetical protein